MRECSGRRWTTMLLQSCTTHLLASASMPAAARPACMAITLGNRADLPAPVPAAMTANVQGVRPHVENHTSRAFPATRAQSAALQGRSRGGSLFGRAVAILKGPPPKTGVWRRPTDRPRRERGRIPCRRGPPPIRTRSTQGKESGTLIGEPSPVWASPLIYHNLRLLPDKRQENSRREKSNLRLFFTSAVCTIPTSHPASSALGFSPAYLSDTRWRAGFIFCHGECSGNP